MTCVGLYFSNSLRVCSGSLRHIASHRIESVPVPIPLITRRNQHSPEIALLRTSEHPSLVRLLAKPRVFRFCLYDMFDCFSYETCSACYKYYCGHRISHLLTEVKLAKAEGWKLGGSELLSKTGCCRSRKSQIARHYSGVPL